MANQTPNSTYSESVLTNTTPSGFTLPRGNSQGASDVAIEDLQKQIELLWKALGDSMKERTEMKLRIEKLESSEKNLENDVDFLKNRVENVTHNNEQLVDEVEKMRIENERMRKALNEMSNAGNQFEEEAGYQERVVEENCELEEMRKTMGEIGGAGHFFGNDRRIEFGGKRDGMDEEQLKKVLQLLAAGEKRINLKEREFRTFLNEKKTEKKLKKSFGGVTIGRSPRLDGRSTSKELGKKMTITISLSRKKVKIKI